MRRGALAWLFPLFLLAAEAGVAGVAAAAPAFEIGPGGFLTVRSLPSILSDKAVASKLTNGLTTTFALTVTARDSLGKESKGAARIDVRYELWDEVFVVSGAGGDGRTIRESFPSLERLAEWWRSVRLPVLPVRGLARAEPWSLAVGLGVIPFSRAEQTDTQRWLNRSLRQQDAEASSGQVSGAVPVSGGVLDLMLSTSIKRKSHLHFDWTVRFAPPER